MTNTILMIVAIVVGIIIVLKFIRFFVKVIILLAVLAIVIMVFMNMTQGMSLPNISNNNIQASAQKELNSITQKVKGINLKQVETDLQNTMTKSINSAKQAWAKAGK